MRRGKRKRMISVPPSGPRTQRMQRSPRGRANSRCPVRRHKSLHKVARTHLRLHREDFPGQPNPPSARADRPVELACPLRDRGRASPGRHPTAPGTAHRLTAQQLRPRSPAQRGGAQGHGRQHHPRFPRRALGSRLAALASSEWPACREGGDGAGRSRRPIPPRAPGQGAGRGSSPTQQRPAAKPRERDPPPSLRVCSSRGICLCRSGAHAKPAHLPAAPMLIPCATLQTPRYFCMFPPTAAL